MNANPVDPISKLKSNGDLVVWRNYCHCHRPARPSGDTGNGQTCLGCKVEDPT